MSPCKSAGLGPGAGDVEVERHGIAGSGSGDRDGVCGSCTEPREACSCASRTVRQVLSLLDLRWTRPRRDHGHVATGRGIEETPCFPWNQEDLFLCPRCGSRHERLQVGADPPNRVGVGSASAGDRGDDVPLRAGVGEGASARPSARVNGSPGGPVAGPVAHRGRTGSRADPRCTRTRYRTSRPPSHRDTSAIVQGQSGREDGCARLRRVQ